jgi:hypothetical protein
MKTTILALLFAAYLNAAEEPGFVPLFNGRNLDGWVNVNCAPETWSVTNGLIHCTGHPTGALRTPRQYENFILELEWRHLTRGGNSGVFIWATPIAAPGVPFLRGIEEQVLDHGYDAKGKNEWYTTHGDVFPIHGARMKPFGRHNGERSFPSEERSKPSPEWNRYRIACTNGTIRLSVNGKEVSGGENCNYRKGYLGLESEGAPVEFRNIRIRELPSANPNPDVTGPLDDGLRSIFDGLDLRGWKPNSRFEMQGEHIALKAGDPAGNSLQTEKEFGNCEFSLDVRRMTESARPPIVEFHGTAITLDGTSTGSYTRFRISSRNGIIRVRRDETEFQTQTSQATLVPSSPFAIRDTGGPLEFMNLYANEGQ